MRTRKNDFPSTIRAELEIAFQTRASAEFAFVKIGCSDLLALWFQLDHVSSSGADMENDSFTIDAKVSTASLSETRRKKNRGGTH